VAEKHYAWLLAANEHQIVKKYRKLQYLLLDQWM